MMSEKERGTVQSVERAFSIVELLCASYEPLSAIEISDALNLKRTTVYGLLDTLLQMAYVVKDDRRYAISGKLYSLSYKYPNRFRVTQAAAKYMVSVSDRFGCTAHLGRLGVDHTVLLIKAVFPSRQTEITSGSPFPLYCSAMGKLLLAYQPQEIRDSVLKEIEPKQLTPTTIVDKALLGKELDNIKTRGYSLDQGEMLDNTYCLSVPIFDNQGLVHTAMSFSTTKENMASIIDELVPIAVQSGKECSMEMGWNPMAPNSFSKV